MVPYENWHVLTLYVAKQGLPRAYAENGPLQHSSTFVYESANWREVASITDVTLALVFANL
jgi:hypothetical protein